MLSMILLLCTAGVEWEHPAGTVTQQTIADVQHKLETCDWAQKAFDDKLNSLDPWFKTPSEQLQAIFPTVCGNVYHVFSCPDDRSKLTFDPLQDKIFTCPSCAKTYDPGTNAGIYEPGNRYDGTMYEGWVCNYYLIGSSAAVELAVMGRVTGEQPLIDRAKELLFLFTKTVEGLPTVQDDNPQMKKILTYHREGDNKILYDLAQAFELLRESMTPEEVAWVKTALLERMLNDLMLEPFYTYDHNNTFQWHRTIVQTALALERDDIIDWSFGYDAASPEQLPEHRSMNRIIAKNFNDDGAFWELCSGYHLYPLFHLCEFAVLSKNLSHMDPVRFPRERYDFTDTSSAGGQVISNALHWFMSMAMPNRRMPTVGDSMKAEAGMDDYFATAEIGYHFYDIKAIGDYEKLRSGGRNWFALLHGAPSIVQHDLPYESAYQTSGIVTLRNVYDGNRVWAHVNAMIAGGSHQHADRLNFLWNAHGEKLLVEKATPYNEKVTRWLGRDTCSHNLVSVGGASQQYGASLKPDQYPEVTHFFSNDWLQSTVVRGDALYEDAEVYRRSVVVIEDIVIDCFDVQGGSPHDWTAQFPNTPPELTIEMAESTFEPMDWLYNGDETILRGTTDTEWEASWKVGEVHARLTMIGAPGTDVYSYGTYPIENSVITDNHPACPTLCVRRTDDSPFLAVWDAWKDAPTWKSLEAGSGGRNLVLETGDHVYHMAFGAGEHTFPDGWTLATDAECVVVRDREDVFLGNGSRLALTDESAHLHATLTGNATAVITEQPIPKAALYPSVQYQTVGGNNIPYPVPDGISVTVSGNFMASQHTGDWPQPRQNAQLTAVQPMPGAMQEAPALLTDYPFAPQTPSQYPVDPSNPDSPKLGLLGGALYCFEAGGSLRWRSHPPELNFTKIHTVRDLNGDGTIEIALEAGRAAQPFGAAVLVSLEDGTLLWRYDVEPMSYQWYLHIGNYLENTPTEEIMVVMMGYPPDKDNGYVAFFEYPANAALPVQKWRYDFHEYTCFPSLFQSDIDSDGLRELIFETHSRMWFLDQVTGALKHFAAWDVSPANMRSYGHVEFVDLNKDGREDFLVIADFAQHHEVLLNTGGAMEKAWHHGWKSSVTTGKIATTWPEKPYADLDGDGQYEIIVSMFNSQEEQAWLIRCYDVLTGEMKYTFPGAAATTVADLDGDGRAEILANYSEDATQTEKNGAVLLSVQDGFLQSLWQDTGAEALTPAPGAGFRIRKAGAVHRLSPEKTLAAYTVPPQAPRQAFPVYGGAFSAELLAADLNGNGVNDVLVYTGGVAVILTWEGGQLTEWKRYPSTGMPVIDDFNLDGKLDLVLSRIEASGPPVLTALTPATEAVIWESTFPAPPGPGLPASRKAYLRSGHFTGNAIPDIYVWAGTPQVRTAVISGETGALIWEKTEFPGITRYWGASVNLASVWDYNQDGAEDLVFTCPDYYCIADGTTGDLLLGPDFPPKIFNQNSQGLYTHPAILPHPKGEPTVCLVDGHVFQAAMSISAQPYWYTLPVTGQDCSGREGFLPIEDGSWRMGFGRQNGHFACVNVADGALLWEYPLQAAASDVVTCDMDNNGQPDFLFGDSHGTLYALDSAGQPIWHYQHTTGLQDPILADINNDGRTEIVATTPDGHILVFGNK